MAKFVFITGGVVSSLGKGITAGSTGTLLDDVTTESVGEQPLRKVVIMPKYDPAKEETAGPATMRIRARRERTFSRPPTASHNERRRPRRSRDR